MNLIEAKSLIKEYTTGKLTSRVLKGLDFSMKEGEFVSIVGPSGSGKTTLLHVLSGLEPATDGTVLLFGKEIRTYSDSEKAFLRANDIGFVFQFFNLIPNLTVVENVKLASVLGNKNTMQDVMGTLDQVGMKEFAHHYPSQISGGMQQRVALARALINRPKILFADEPIGNLDYKNGVAMMELFERLNKTEGKTILMVTHNEDTVKYGTRTIRMLDGLIVHDETHV